MISPRQRWPAFAAGRRIVRRSVAGVAVALIAASIISCGDDNRSPSQPAPATTASTSATTPSGTPSPPETVWLCRPGMPDNPCASDLTTSVVSADGRTMVEEAPQAEDPPIDCFYVYPTVSGQPGLGANLNIDAEETVIAIYHASRFSEVCKVYAPMYRQLTLIGIISKDDGKTAVRELAYDDVLDAWQDYLANYNNGRGFVLIGHSQGTMMLTRLITNEIDPNPEVRQLLVSALLIGGNVLVAKGEEIGGDFQNIPACRSADQTGCVVAYSAFLEPPPSETRFGRVGAGPPATEMPGGDLEVLCVNPASLSGRSGPLEPYISTVPFPGNLGPTYIPLSSFVTPWVSFPEMYTAECRSSDGLNWLEVDTTGIEGDQRPVVEQRLGPTWGLHLYDVNLALGNLLDLVREQSAAFSE